MKEYNFFKTYGHRPSEEQTLDTQLFYRNSPEIYARFDEWKDNERFYFIPLYLEMTYSCGWVAEVAPDPVWLGSFMRCILDHPEMFHYKCPDCGKTVFPHRYTGSPLSGIVILEGRCNCGWHGYERVCGWRERAVVLRDNLEEDSPAYKRFARRNKAGAPTVMELLEWMHRQSE